MTQRLAICLMALLLLYATSVAEAQHSYAGFDRNEYLGDAALSALRKSFFYTGYWLNNPPGDRRNSWVGKRALLKQHRFGFLVLFSGRLYKQLKGVDAASLGVLDGKAAVAAAAREGFPQNVLIFLDQEEGGHLLPEQVAYLFAWADTVQNSGGRAGVYCSGIDAPEGGGVINTARDIVELEYGRAKLPPQDSSLRTAGKQKLALWIANDQCPPSPGCTVANPPISAAVSPGLSASTVVWQYAQSPRRPEFSAGCPRNQATDGNCYAPGLPHGASTFLDLNTADSPDPSEAP